MLSALVIPVDPPCDERNDAKVLADFSDMQFHDVELHTSDMVAAFPEMVYWRDDPIADISGYGYYSVMKLAREHNVPVVLQGQGGDELFWGYPWVKEAVRRSERLSTIRETGWRILSELIRTRLPQKFNPKSWYRWLRSGAGISSVLEEYRDALNRPENRLCFYDLTGDFLQTQKEMNKWYNREFAEKINDQDECSLFTIPQPWPSLDVLFTKLICATYLREMASHKVID